MSRCITCGSAITGKHYNPYNLTCKEHACSGRERRMCQKCAESFVKENNQYKGGRWVLDKEDDNAK